MHKTDLIRGGTCGAQQIFGGHVPPQAPLGDATASTPVKNVVN